MGVYDTRASELMIHFSRLIGCWVWHVTHARLFMLLISERVKKKDLSDRTLQPRSGCCR